MTMRIKFLGYCSKCFNWFHIKKFSIPWIIFKHQENCIYCGSRLKLEHWDDKFI